MKDRAEPHGEVLPVQVYLAGNHLEADVVRGLLESEGIPAILQYDSVGVIYGLTIDGLGETRILVPAPLEEKARRVLAAEMGGSGAEELLTA